MANQQPERRTGLRAFFQLGTGPAVPNTRSGSAASVAAHESGCGPKLPTWAVRQVGSYLRHTGHGADAVAEAARDPEWSFASRTGSLRNSSRTPWADCHGLRTGTPVKSSLSVAWTTRARDRTQRS